MVRIATINDIYAIARLYREQFKEMSKLIPDFIKEGDQKTEFLENTITNENSDILVYENNGDIVGFTLLQAKIRPAFEFLIPGKFCYIMDIIVTKPNAIKDLELLL